eukprot:3365582-Amphidinium_carterae.1
MDEEQVATRQHRIDSTARDGKTHTTYWKHEPFVERERKNTSTNGEMKFLHRNMLHGTKPFL